MLQQYINLAAEDNSKFFILKYVSDNHAEVLRELLPHNQKEFLKMMSNKNMNKVAPTLKEVVADPIVQAMCGANGWKLEVIEKVITTTVEEWAK